MTAVGTAHSGMRNCRRCEMAQVATAEVVTRKDRPHSTRCSASQLRSHCEADAMRIMPRSQCRPCEVEAHPHNASDRAQHEIPRCACVNRRVQRQPHPRCFIYNTRTTE